MELISQERLGVGTEGKGTGKQIEKHQERFVNSGWRYSSHLFWVTVQMQMRELL